MPDYDVGVLSLATPPPAAPVTSYRPAVRVKNNGIHPANVSGVMRVYRREPPGDLLHSFTLSLANLAAGNEGDATANGYWIPVAADVGREYLFTADVTTEHDQVEPNNHLAPVTVLITAAEPPPPPILGNHATQHENGGGDEINLDGLAGKLLEDQDPTAHKTTHASGGADELSVAGLKGQLADPQPTSPHHLEHQLGGSDKLNVNGLFGTLDGDQKPKAHGSAKHDETVASRDGTGLVPTAELGTGQPGQAAFLRGDRTWAAPIATPSPHAATHQATGDDEISITGLSGKTADAQTPEAHKLSHQLLGDDQIAISGLIGNPAARDAASGLAPIDPFRWLPGRNLTPLTSVCNFPGTPGGLPINEPILPGASNPTVQTWIIYTPTTKVAGIFAHISANFTFPPLCPDYACHIEVRIEHGSTLIDTKYARYSLKLGGSCSLFDHVIPLSLVVAMHTDLDSDYQMTVRYWNDTAATTITVEQTGVVIGHASASEPPV